MAKNGTSKNEVTVMEIHERIVNLHLAEAEIASQLGSIREDIAAAKDELRVALGHEAPVPAEDIEEETEEATAEEAPIETVARPRRRRRRKSNLVVYNAVRKEQTQIGKIRAYFEAVKRPVDLEELRRQSWIEEGTLISQKLHALANQGRIARVGRGLWQSVGST